MRLYVASSWRNLTQPDVVNTLRAEGHEVYDFRNPRVDNNGFKWSDIDPTWQGWDPAKFRDSLSHPVAERGFSYDWQAMEWADACVLVLPCGRSAHIEAGYFVGARKPLIILLAHGEPELMYKMATHICCTLGEVIRALALIQECRCQDCITRHRLRPLAPLRLPDVNPRSLTSTH